MKIVSIVGARPQFIKASAVSRALRPHIRKYWSTPASITTRICRIFSFASWRYRRRITTWKWAPARRRADRRDAGADREVLARERPTGVLIYGDTNSTLRARWPRPSCICRWRM
jgi:hypothetical protein